MGEIGLNQRRARIVQRLPAQGCKMLAVPGDDGGLDLHDFESRYPLIFQYRLSRKPDAQPAHEDPQPLPSHAGQRDRGQAPVGGLVVGGHQKDAVADDLVMGITALQLPLAGGGPDARQDRAA